MVKRRENEEFVPERRERSPPIENNKGSTTKRQKNQRHSSAKDGESRIANDERSTKIVQAQNKHPDTKPTSIDHKERGNNKQLKNKLADNDQFDDEKSDNKPHDNNQSDNKLKERKKGQAKQIVKGNNEVSKNTTSALEELQNYKNRLMNARINKELVKNMKESMLSLNVLMSGFNKQVSQVRQQQRNAFRIWDNLEAHLVKMNADLCDEINQTTNTDNGIMGGRTATPTVLPLPHIINSFSRKSCDVSRQNSLPSVFKNNDTPGEKESEIFTANRTNNIRKVAQRRTKEKSTNAADLFPAVTQERGMPLLRLTASGNDAKSKIPSFLGSKEARQRVAKRLTEMKAFQEKYLVEPNRSQTTANESILDISNKQEQRKRNQ